MPLDKSGSKESVGKNIKAEEAVGKPHKQAIAIALDVQRRALGHDGKKHERPNESPAHERKETKAQEAYEQRTGREIGTDGKKWIQGAIKHPGALHRDLGVPKGEKIPEGKLESAAEKGGKVGQRARLAETLKHMGHDGHGAAPCSNCGTIHWK